MENKFKVGDKVRVRKDIEVGKEYNGGCLFAYDMEKYKGKETTIKISFKRGDEVGYTLHDMSYWTFTDDMLERVEFTKDDLQDGDIVTLRNGDKLVLFEEDFINMSDDNTNYLDYLSELRDDLTYSDDDEDFRDSDVVKVERPNGYATLFERNEEVKEMTIAEISKALGYEVKIVKEEK